MKDRQVNDQLRESLRSSLHRKAQNQKKLLLRTARVLDQRLHLIQISFQRATSLRRQAVFRLRHPTFERLLAGNVFGLFQLARMDAKIAVSGIQQLLEVIEGERTVHCQSAQDSQPQSLMDQPIEFQRRRLRACNCLRRRPITITRSRRGLRLHRAAFRNVLFTHATLRAFER